jgi:hypothetical protein
MSVLTAEAPPPQGQNTFSITWVPGTDVMLGVCHCGAEHVAEDPVELWEWLLGHPAGHDVKAS